MGEDNRVSKEQNIKTKSENQSLKNHVNILE